tara:strand:+ start:1286 stop:2119 length:834 start_codon:yes stop_codon:yes gene_type:complete
MAISEEFSVEFDDALLDLDGWKNPRYNGSKLTGALINRFTEGDTTYGKNPVIENKISALYIGRTIIDGEEEPSRTKIQGHSYVAIDKILLIDVETDKVQIIERQSIINPNTGTVGNELAFKRFITKDLFEGSIINVRLIDKTIQNSLKTNHVVKFNRGSLMKVYEYTANSDGFEDGVFGGFGIRNNTGSLFNGHTGSLEGPGLFGYGMTVAASRSLFTTSSIQFVDSLPSELNDYTGELELETMGSLLSEITASVGSVEFEDAFVSADIAPGESPGP